jgi:serine phosphatase RsbU (regulator of sigma subunit)
MSTSITTEQVKSILNVSRLFAVATELDPLLTRIAEAGVAILACERVSIFLHDAGAKQLWTKVALGADEIRLSDNVGIVGDTFTRNEIIIDHDPYKNPHFDSGPDKRFGYVTRSILAAPMVDIDGRPLGVIQAINKSSGEFSTVDQSLVLLLAEQAGAAIQRYRLQLVAMEIVALRREMFLARVVQDAMIPKTIPQLGGFRAAGRSVPASFTGGDCFDFWKTPRGDMGLFIADATGHGLAPTLIVSQARALVRVLSDLEADPRRILERANYRLYCDLDGQRFVTAFLGFLSGDGELKWFSAGHAPIFVRPSAGKSVQLLKAHVAPLGAVEEFGDVQSDSLQLDEGGLLALISDGIFEAFDPQHQQFEIARVVETLNQSGSPDELLDALFARVKAWQRIAEPRDDQTVMIITRENA